MSIGILKYLWETNIRARKYTFLDTHSKCKYQFPGAMNIQVFIGGYSYKAYIHTIQTLHWALYIKSIISQVYSLMYSWILGPPMVYIVPLCSNLVYLRPPETVEGRILDWYSQILSIHTRLSPNTRKYRMLEYSRDIREYYVMNTRANASIGLAALTNIMHNNKDNEHFTI